ncbi:MgtC/SapB family protein [[Clostridium] innocuum]|uniref:MgtC/SapB family protein n=1 Tax=Clostridium sp. DFI.1.208 TaxID=2965527 RepID=UPI001E4F2972|nr:MgtC/SapB family protein [[Clostridium] innocuum]MCC2844199.1 MgtC/SapB family protein [[Clostridium] innocuum]MCC2848324.1 MgtC/SapB family protein [[Clostridium] innocuum]MCC2852765.1 MgtC/SapB family protein [[Clostridium] innocuum]
MMNIMQLETQMEFLVRILLAGICGGIIGYERKSRNKEAGIRTHLIVASGAALIMIVSKYGFSDILGDKGIALDPSRIAAQIVTGVGFLGAGMIFIHKKE